MKPKSARQLLHLKRWWRCLFTLFSLAKSERLLCVRSQRYRPQAGSRKRLGAGRRTSFFSKSRDEFGFDVSIPGFMLIRISKSCLPFPPTGAFQLLLLLRWCLETEVIVIYR
jgi:hypothetical protein